MTDNRSEPLLYIYSQLGRLEAQVKALQEGKVDKLDLALLDVKIKGDRTADLKDLNERIRDKLNALNSQLLRNGESGLEAGEEARRLSAAMASLSADITSRFAQEDEEKADAAQKQAAQNKRRAAFAKTLLVRVLVLCSIGYAIATEGPSAARHVPKWFAMFAGWFGG